MFHSTVARRQCCWSHLKKEQLEVKVKVPVVTNTMKRIWISAYLVKYIPIVCVLFINLI